MNKRKLGRTGIEVGELGLGGEHLQDKPYEIVEQVVRAALEGGMDVLDVFMSQPKVREDIGKALGKDRNKMLIQGHIGAVWENGQYGRSRDLQKNKRHFDELLRCLGTDYMDIGMIHFIDDEAECRQVFDGPILEYALGMKREGRIRFLGLSSHDPVAALHAVRTGLLDVLMFSINPGFDLLPQGTDIDAFFDPDTYRAGSMGPVNPDRMRLYQACEEEGVAITVMKTLGAGLLLNGEVSPVGKALTVGQCIAYALDRPAVSSVLIGCQTAAEVQGVLRYAESTPQERDYASALAGQSRFESKGRCMYCNHCLPCPARIDIAQVNKYLDMASLRDAVPDTVKAHYLALGQTASDCIQCGVCEERCPFEVPIRERMRAAEAVFGRG